ncbi:MAG: methyl-accepting chemotaxis protein [Leptospiraceae bacterium]|nr:methyl-accepting chemotaxis protein [Leptospiraceae bacterium]
MKKRSLSLSLLFLSEGFSTFFVVPLTLIFLFYFVEPNGKQYFSLLIGVSIGFIFYMIPFFLKFFHYSKGLKDYLSLIEKNKFPDVKDYSLGWKSYISLPGNLSLLNFFRWLIGSTITLSFFSIMGGSSSIQNYYLISILLFATLLNTAYTHIAVEILLSKIGKLNYFDRPLIEDEDHRTYFRSISRSAPFILSIGIASLSIIIILFSAKLNESLFISSVSSGSDFSVSSNEEIILKNMINQSLIAGLTTFFVSLFFFFYLKTKLSPLVEVNSLLGKLAQGNLHNQTIAIYPDDIGKLSMNINSMISQLSMIISDILHVSNNGSNSSEEMTTSLSVLTQNAQTQASSSEEISASIEQINATLENITVKTEDQVHQIHLLKEYINALTDANNKVKLNINSTIQSVRTMTTDSKKGQSSLESMKSSIESIDKSSEQIRSVIEIITSISDQINLLALNAAIEAARAGDYGKGFSVVAEEIGKLASKTAKSIKEIDSYIRKSDEDIRKGTNTIEDTAKIFQVLIHGIQNFGSLVNSVSDNIETQLSYSNNIIVSNNTILKISQGIESSMKEVKSATLEIGQAIYNFNDSTQSNAAGMEELSASSESISNMALDMKKKMNLFEV